MVDGEGGSSSSEESKAKDMYQGVMATPKGCDATDESSILKWLKLFPPPIPERDYGPMLIAAGYESLILANFTEEDLMRVHEAPGVTDGRAIPLPHARMIAKAARSIQSTLEEKVGEDSDSEPRETRRVDSNAVIKVVSDPRKDAGDPPDFPMPTLSGMPPRKESKLFLKKYSSWLRQMDAEYHRKTTAMVEDLTEGKDVKVQSVVDGLVSDDIDGFVAAKLYKVLPDDYQDVITDETSALRMVRDLFAPVLKHTDEMVHEMEEKFRKPDPETVKEKLYVRLLGWSDELDKLADWDAPQHPRVQVKSLKKMMGGIGEVAEVLRIQKAVSGGKKMTVKQLYKIGMDMAEEYVADMPDVKKVVKKKAETHLATSGANTKKDCRFWVMKALKCRKGEDCDFRHDPKKENTDLEDVKAETALVVCGGWRDRGVCRRKRCPFNHDDGDESGATLIPNSKNRKLTSTEKMKNEKTNQLKLNRGDECDDVVGSGDAIETHCDDSTLKVDDNNHRGGSVGSVGSGGSAKLPKPRLKPKPKPEGDDVSNVSCKGSGGEGECSTTKQNETTNKNHSLPKPKPKTNNTAKKEAGSAGQGADGVMVLGGDDTGTGGDVSSVTCESGSGGCECSTTKQNETTNKHYTLPKPKPKTNNTAKKETGSAGQSADGVMVLGSDGTDTAESHHGGMMTKQAHLHCHECDAVERVTGSTCPCGGPKSVGSGSVGECSVMPQGLSLTLADPDKLKDTDHGAGDQSVATRETPGMTVAKLLVVTVMAMVSGWVRTKWAHSANWIPTLLDSGCSRDMLGSAHTAAATDTYTDEEVTVRTANGERVINETGDYEHEPGLQTRKGLMAPWMPFTLLSLVSRLKQGFTFKAKGSKGELTGTDGTKHLFRENAEGLMQLHKHACDCVECGCDNNVPQDSFWVKQEQALSASVKEQRNAKDSSSKFNNTMYLIMAIITALNAAGMIAPGGVNALAPMVAAMNTTGFVKDAVAPVVQRKQQAMSMEQHCRQGHMPHCANCEACIRARLTQKKALRRAPGKQVTGAEKGYVIGVDFVGPFSPDVDNNKYGFVTVEVGHTDYGIVQLSKNKEAATTLDMIKGGRRLLETESVDDKKVTRMHHDNDKSFDSVVKTYLKDEKITDTVTGGYRPTNNSRTERRNRTLKEAFKANLLMATGGIGVYNALWGPGLVHSNYCINRVQWADGRTPVQALTGNSYKFDKTQDYIFGQKVYYHKPEPTRADTWEASGGEAIWVGVSDQITGGHVVVPIKWDPKNNQYKLYGTHHTAKVKATEISFPLRMGPVQQKEMNKQEWDEFLSPIYAINEDKDYVDDQVDGEDPLLVVESIENRKGKGNKVRYQVKWEGSDVMTWEPAKHLTKYGAKGMLTDFNLARRASGAAAKYCSHSGALLCATLYSVGTDTFTTAESEDHLAVTALIKAQRTGGSVEDWLPGYKKELDEVKKRRLTALQGEEITKEVRQKAVKLRMILEKKRDGRRKGRLILQGFREPACWDNGPNDSPVAGASSIRSLLFRSGAKDDIVSSVDVSVAFLQSEEYDTTEQKRYVYFKPRAGVEPQYFRLRGSIYGQRSASKKWYQTISGYLVRQGFVAGIDEPCLFTHPETGLVVLIYVDDIICRGSPKATDAFYAHLSDPGNGGFDCKEPTFLDHNNPLHFIGFDIHLDASGEGDVVSIDQSDAISDFLSTQNVRPVQNIQSPMVSGHIDRDTEELNDQQKAWYQSVVGTLTYFSRQTRWDLGYTANRLSQECSRPTVAAKVALQRALSYLMATQDFAISGRYGDLGGDRMITYSDSDLAGNSSPTTKSQTGTMILLNGVPVQWTSKTQCSTSVSIAQAEIYALSSSLRDAKDLYNRVIEMGLKILKPLVVRVDNEQARSFSEQTCVRSRLRGIFRLSDGYVQELRDRESLKTEYVKAENNASNILTKPLAAADFRREKRLIARQWHMNN